ncbi:MAG: helix-turn-helix domain-containing protein [Reinekea forsetii]|nr:helix-turn-helix domain-containing protein [Reinekea forsetii]
MNSLCKRFGRRVREVRCSLNITQEQLADMAEIDRGHMGHIERGTKCPSLNKVEQIAKALNVQEHELMRDCVESMC